MHFSYLLIVTDIAIAIIGYAESQAVKDLKCTDTGDLCSINRTCEYNCRFPCCNNGANNIFVSGSSIYSSDSSICRSALHDLRISLHNATARKVKIRSFQQENCFLESSVRYGFSSSSFQNESCSLFEFVSPRISEEILDVVSMHSNFLYGQNETHTQVCATASNATEQKVVFGTYSEWESCYRGRKAKKIVHEGLVEYKNIWSDRHSTGGFQCIPSQTDLSTVTSIGFYRDASFFPEHLTITANKFENVTLRMTEMQEILNYETVWKKDGEVLLEIDKKRTEIHLIDMRESNSGIYSLGYSNSDDEDFGFMQLIVRACPRGKFGDNCSKSCSTCLNGGVCHDITGDCICAPGFNGSHCEEACRPGYVGKICNMKCFGESLLKENTCKGLSICLPSPFGCSCASGYTGLFCDEVCANGFYGAGCLQKHKHVHRKEETCSKFSDFCECLSGWHGTNCNESYPVLNRAPSLLYATENSIAMSFTKWSNNTDLGSGIPVWYEVVFKEPHDNRWDLGLTVPVKSEIQTYQVQIHNLKPATEYVVGVVVVDETENKQETGIKTIDVATLCDTPSMPPSDIELSSANQHIYVRWMLPPREDWNCWEISINIIARELSTNLFADCIMADNFSCSFFSDPQDTWLIHVCASTNETKENCAKPKNITAEGIAHSSPVELEIIKKETALSIYWLPARFLSKLSHYVINYVDVDTNVSNSDTVQAQDAACEEKGSYHCHTIQRLKPGHTYAIEILAFMKNVNDGNIVKSFIVHLEKKSQALSVVLGISVPLLLILCMIIFIIILYKRNKAKSSLKVKFLPYKMESEFASCNEALDEMEIIETESIGEEISNVISIDKLPEYVKQGLLNVKIRKEFMSVPTCQIYPCSIAKLGENKPKNRYGNILPYDHSRVILDTTNEDLFSNYIHANYIHGYNKVKKYIATQGPLPNTVNDFWRMVWNEDSCKILMITNFVENGKYKCEKYWSEASSVYGDIEVSFKDSKSYADFIIRTFDISKDKVSREIKQFHFTAWPDHGAPTNTTTFIHFLKMSRCYKPDSEASIIVHCSAGIGRTGATILLDSMMDMSQQEKKVDLVNHLCSMRKQRMNIVENFDQYVFVYHALVESLCFEDTCIKLTDFKEEIKKMKSTDKITGMTYIEKQFKALETLNIQLMGKDVQVAYQTENQSKNRSMFILPPDKGRPSLSRDSTHSDYINAVYVDSFTIKNAYIATQYPLPETLVDFWSMIYVQKSKIVLLLQEMDYSVEGTPRLWHPNDRQKFGEFEIHCESVSEESEITVVHATLCVPEQKREPISIDIFVLNNWNSDSNLPTKMSNLLSALSKVHALNSVIKTTITSVCSDGATGCGIFCAVLYICDQIKEEKEVDIFRAVKCIRSNRPQFILNLAQYEFLFDIVSAYLDSSEI